MAITQSGIILYGILTAVILFGAVVSLSTNYRIRRYRNFALLLAYLLGIVSLFLVPFFTAVIVWIVSGIVGGLSYAIYEVWAQARAAENEPKPGFQYGHIIYGPFAWPLMFMEAAEYVYAELTGSEPRPTSDSA